ncbi:MAG: DinB family protein [Chloroflexi bacterium]|nr:DinB family protein [Chloroflexota bacterium]
MTSFSDLFEYNTWANGQLVALTDHLSSAELEAPMPELGGSVLELLEHASLVEAAFLGLMTGSGPRPDRERGYAEIRETFRTTSDGYRDAMPGLETRLGQPFEVPWFGRTFTIEQGLLQVVTHSVQHRAGIAAGIARARRDVPSLDYIIWLSKHR